MEELDINKQNKESNNSENTKNSLITIAKLNKYFLFPFICPLFCVFTNFFLAKINELQVIKREYILLFFVELSYAVGGLLYFVSYFKQKDNKESQTYNYKMKFLKNLKTNNNSTNNLKKKWFIIILMCCLFAFFHLVCDLYMNNHLFESRMYFILFIPLFSRFILKISMYKHQYFSLIISILGIIFIIIPVTFVIEKDDIIPNLFICIGGICYSLALVLIKYVIEVYYISAFKINLLIGIISIIASGFGFMIYSLIKYHDLSYLTNCYDYSGQENKFIVSLYFIIAFIFASILRVFTVLVIFYFSPILLMVTDIISPMISWIISVIIKGPSTTDVIVSPIGYLITLVSSLIFSEIIILNFWGLNSNTKIFVEERQKKELIELAMDEDDIKLEEKNESLRESISPDYNL